MKRREASESASSEGSIPEPSSMVTQIAKSLVPILHGIQQLRTKTLTGIHFLEESRHPLNLILGGSRRVTPSPSEGEEHS
jgi:hypothetical protein